MSCISGNIKLISLSVAASVSIVGQSVNADVTKATEGLKLACTSINEHPTLGCNIIKSELTLNISQICQVNKGKYIKVDKNVVWVTQDIWEQIMIQSNTDWEIV